MIIKYFHQFVKENLDTQRTMRDLGMLPLPAHPSVLNLTVNKNLHYDSLNFSFYEGYTFIFKFKDRVPFKYYIDMLEELNHLLEKLDKTKSYRAVLYGPEYEGQQKEEYDTTLKWNFSDGFVLQDPQFDSMFVSHAIDSIKRFFDEIKKIEPFDSNYPDLNVGLTVY